MKKIVVALAFCGSNAMGQVTVTVNPAIQYQTIKGWGGTGGQNTQFEGTPAYMINQIINVSVNDLGLTGLRYECFQGSYSQSYAMCRSWEWTNDNGSPDTTLWTAFDTTGVDNYMQNLFVPWKNAVTANGEPFTFYESPSWYVNGSTGDIPEFLRYSPGEYAEYLISNLNYLRNKYGLTADYVTICNEAGNNNVFTPQLVDTMIRTVGARLAAEGLSTKIQFPECVSAQTSWTYIQALQSDAAIWPYIKCLSYHLYGTNDPYRADIQNFAQTMGIPTAQTEYVGLGIDLLFQDLLWGGVSYWDFYGNSDYMPLNANNTWFTFGAKFWTTRQVIRHVRPGAVRIGAPSSDPSVKVLAFSNAGQITTILLNDSTTSTTQNVTISGLPAGNYAIGRSTTSGTYSELGVVTVGAPGTLTVNSVVNTVMCIYPHPVDVAPVATLWAANPTYLDLPSSTVTLSSNAIDPELETLSYRWTADSFPASATVTISNPNIANASVTGLTVPGDYVFGVHISDGINTTTKQVTVQVFAGNQPPYIAELQSRIPVIVTLPVDTTVLQAYAFDPEADALTMGFTLISQPTGASAQLVNLVQAGGQIRTSARNMTVAGDYIFQYWVADGSHTVTRNITVTVYPLNNAPVITSVAAAPAAILTTDTTNLTAVTSDPDGDIITHWWLVKSVPVGASPIFSAQGEKSTTVSNLSVPGTYVFTLRAIDRTLMTTKDDTVIVSEPLPVTFEDFTATLIPPGAAELQWKTAMEQNTAWFIIQRSLDGSQFSSIGKIPAAGNSNSEIDYSFMDSSLHALPNAITIVYYRVGELDLDGKEKYSEIRTIRLNGRQSTFTLVPNPVTDFLNVQFINIRGQGTLQVYDLTGRKLQESLQSFDAAGTIEINTSRLVPGCYFLRIQVNGSSYQQRFVKIR
jgi:O-glycosyl hydrolase